MRHLKLLAFRNVCIWKEEKSSGFPVRSMKSSLFVAVVLSRIFSSMSYCTDGAKVDSTAGSISWPCSESVTNQPACTFSSVSYCTEGARVHSIAGSISWPCGSIIAPRTQSVTARQRPICTRRWQWADVSELTK